MSKRKIIDSTKSTIIQELLKESTITDLFENLCFADIKNVKIMKSYDYNNEHVGLIVEMQKNNSDEIEKIIIDAVVGYPVIEQIYEAVYKKGSHCDKRIITYTEGFADLDTYGGRDDDVIKNLVENLNEYGTNISLVKMKYDPDEGRFKYSVTEEPSGNLDYNPTNLPTEEKLKEEEFWEVYYWQQFENGYYPWEAFTGDLHEPRKFGHVFGPDDGVEFYVKWTDQGLFFEATDQYDKIEYLESIWNSGRDELQRIFPNEEMTFIFKPGKLPKLLVKIWSAPVQSLVNATTSEKKRLASEISEKFYDFIDFIIFRMNDLKHENGNVEELQEVEELAETV